MAVVFTFIGFLTLVLSVSPSPPVLYMSNNCGKKISVNSSVQFQLNYDWPRSNPCVVGFISGLVNHKDNFLSARILDVDIETDIPGQCVPCRVDILDYDGVKLSPYSGICGYSPPSVPYYASTGNVLQVQFQKYQTARRTASFDILITAFAKGVCAPVPLEFTCTNSKRCVNNSVTCDGFQDCPDDSDETLSSCPLPADVIAGICLAVIFGIALLIVVMIAVHRRKKHGSVFGVFSAPGRESTITSAAHRSYGTHTADPEVHHPPNHPPKHSNNINSQFLYNTN